MGLFGEVLLEGRLEGPNARCDARANQGVRWFCSAARSSRLSNGEMSSDAGALSGDKRVSSGNASYRRATWCAGMRQPIRRKASRSAAITWEFSSLRRASKVRFKAPSSASRIRGCRSLANDAPHATSRGEADARQVATRAASHAGPKLLVCAHPNVGSSNRQAPAYRHQSTIARRTRGGLLDGHLHRVGRHTAGSQLNIDVALARER